MRREIFSATLGDQDVAILTIVAKREHEGNRSAALRALIQEAGKERGLWPVAPQTQPLGKLHAQPSAT